MTSSCKRTRPSHCWYVLELWEGLVLFQLEVIEGLGSKADPESSLEDIRMDLFNLFQIFEENLVHDDCAAWVFLAQVKYQLERVVIDPLRKLQTGSELFTFDVS